MNAIQSVTALTASLVHASATGCVSQQRRHASFIRTTLSAAFATLAVAPFYLAFHGAPSPVDCVLFCLGLLPMGATMLVARTGRLVTGHIVMAATLAAVGLTVLLGTNADASAAIAWLIAAHFELSLAGDHRAARVASIVIALLSIAIVAATLFLPSSAASSSDGWVAVIALSYLALRARGVLAANRQNQPGVQADGETWRAVADAMGNLVVAFEADGSVNRVSAACEGMLGLPADDLMGRGLFDRVHVADRPAFLTLIADAAHGEGTMSGTLRLRTGTRSQTSAGYAEPRHVWMEMQAKGLAKKDDDARGSKVVSILRDVTNTHQHAIDLEQANQASEKAIRAKDHFLANMSHELRTPLNAIIGFSEMLGSRTLRPIEPDKQREYATIIHGSGQHLLAVVNSILDMSKIQSGTFAILPEPFAVDALVEQCCDMIRLEAQNGNVAVKVDVPDNLEEIVGDRRACKQILLNLLSNAVKFTPERGLVTVKVRPDGNTLKISVSDTGIGIAATDLACLGDPFFQARSTLCRPYDGTGLGLSVVRGLLGLHGGAIAIESEIGKGTLVTVRLPLDCRVTPATTAPRIETIARRQPTETFANPAHSRMKQIA